MSASQGRLLALTSRRQDLEMRSQMITQRRLILANQTQEASEIYATATNNKHLYFNTKDSSNPPRLTYNDIIKPYEEGGLGFRLTDYEGYVLVPKLPEGKTHADDGRPYKVVPDVMNPDKLEAAIRGGNWAMEKSAKLVDSDTPRWQRVNFAEVPTIYDNYDTTDNAAAEATMQRQTREVASKDKSLEMELKSIETEHKAIESEFESVQKVIMKNAETSYKTFNA